MKKLLAISAILVLSGFAQAEDKGTEFKFGGELRERYSLDQNPTFLNSNAMTESNWVSRNQFHVNAISGDKLQAYINMLHYAVWGGAGTISTNPGAYAGTAPGTPSLSSASQNNAVQVNEAWMWWKVSDSFAARIGRTGVNYGDGLVVSRNDWLNNPFNAEGIMGRFSWDFLDLDLDGVKIGDLGMTNITAPGVTAAGTTTDTEVVFYGLYASFKNLPDFLKVGEVFAFQLNGDTSTGFAAGTLAPGMTGASGGWNLTTYGLHAKGDFAIVDYRLDGALQNGKQKNAGLTAAGTVSDLTFTGTMLDAELGANFPEFMKGRVYLAYHWDTGNDSADGTQNHQYQPLLYDMHRFTGFMNVFGFGNLTDIRAGLTLMPGEDTTVGLEVNLPSRTTTNAPATIITNANSNQFTPTQSATTGSAAIKAASAALGTEVDVTAKHTYGHGFSIMAGLGYMTLGSYFTATGIGPTSAGSAYQFVAQGTYSF